MESNIRQFDFNEFQINIHNVIQLEELIKKELEDKDMPHHYLDEVRIEFLETFDSIEFLQNLASNDRLKASDLKRWDTPYLYKTRKEDINGKIEVNLTNPHKLENMDYFRQAAITFNDTGRYTHLYPNKNPYSEYAQYWAEEARRCREGMVRPEDGEWIPGYLYFYWNYGIIQRIVTDELTLQDDRITALPNVYDGDYIFFHYLEKARKTKKHTATLKKRGCGFSFKGGAKLCRNFIFGESAVSMKNTNSFAIAGSKEYLTKDGVLNKFLAMADFCAENTPFPRLRELKNSINDMEWKMGYKDKTKSSDAGIKNSVTGVTLGNDPHRARGKRGILIEWEEVGSFSNFLTAWGVARPSVEADGKVFGLMNAYGCLTAGNKVWDNEGNLINIEDLDISKGILGYKDSDGVSKENITYWQPPAKKQCIKITTNSGRSIECSKDHPILWSKKDYGSQPRINGKRPFIKKTKFVKAKDINIGEQLAIIDEVNIWSNKKMWYPRLIGLLMGGGSYNFNKTPVLSSCDKETIFYVESNFDHVIEKSYITKNKKIYKEIRIKNICEELRKVGIYGQSKNNKRLPIDIHSYSKETVCELLGGLFDADGHYQYKTKYPEINLTSGCKELLLEVQLLCNKLGIHGNIIEIRPSLKSKIKSKNNYYRFGIRNKISLDRFIKLIKSNIDYKIKSLNIIKHKIKNIRSNASKSIKGLQFERVVKIEYTGLQEIYNLTAGKTHTYIGNGIVTHNTGGEEGADFSGLQEIFYSPKGYGIASMPNVFDKNVYGRTNCAFFFPQYLNAESFYDENGNSDVIGALIEILVKRLVIKYNTTDPNAIVQEKAEKPITPQEAIMRTEGSCYPVAALKDYLEEISPNIVQFTNEHYVGDIIYDQGKPKWKPLADIKPIRSFPLKDKRNPEGAIEVFEMPKKDKNDLVFKNRYIAGADPIDNDYTLGSLASVFVFDTWTDRIVAEYTGRPVLASEYYRKCMMLCKFYNAKLNYENNLKGLFSYFSNENCTYILCDTPQYLRDIEAIGTETLRGNKSKGTRTTKEIIRVGKTLQREWMLTQQEYVEYDESTGEEISFFIENYRKIRSKAYIEECIAWHEDGNFDRCSAMDMVMILREDIKRNIDYYKEERDSFSQIENDDFIDKNWNHVMSNYNKMDDWYELNLEGIHSPNRNNVNVDLY